MTTSADDIVKKIENDMEKEKKIEIIRNDVIKKTEDTADYIQRYVYKNSNPNPIIVALCILFLILGLWLLHILFLKPHLNGKWRYSKTGEIWEIQHNKFNNSILITRINKEKSQYKLEKLKGELINNLFSYDDKIGIWDLGDIIIFINGENLQKIND